MTVPATFPIDTAIRAWLIGGQDKVEASLLLSHRAIEADWGPGSNESVPVIVKTYNTAFTLPYSTVLTVRRPMLHTSTHVV